MINPYNSKTPSKVFYGRQKIRTKLQKEVLLGHRSYLILGGAKIGKTALLHQIEQDFLQIQTESKSSTLSKSSLFIYFDLANLFATYLRFRNSQREKKNDNAFDFFL